jgi:hypothetical protein
MTVHRWVVTLFRTEVLQIHAAYEVTLGSLRDQKKLSKQKVCVCVCVCVCVWWLSALVSPISVLFPLVITG